MSAGYDLYARYTLEELVAMNEKVRATGKQSDKDSFYLYPPKTRAKLDAIGYAIYYHMKEAAK